MSTEHITNPLKLRHWHDHMEPDYAYTLGIARERFFKEIKENGRIILEPDVRNAEKSMFRLNCIVKNALKNLKNRSMLEPEAKSTLIQLHAWTNTAKSLKSRSFTHS